MLVDHAHLKHELLDGGFTEFAENLVVRDLLRHLQTLAVSQCSRWLTDLS